VRPIQAKRERGRGRKKRDLRRRIGGLNRGRPVYQKKKKHSSKKGTKFREDEAQAVTREECGTKIRNGNMEWRESKKRTSNAVRRRCLDALGRGKRIHLVCKFPVAEKRERVGFKRAKKYPEMHN